MATRLYPKRNNINTNHEIFKYRLNCQEKIDSSKDTKEWLELENKIDHKSSDYKLFHALLEKEKHIVVKIGPSILTKEFQIAKELETLKLSTFLHYYCKFQCLDDFNKLNNSSKYLCKDSSGKEITILVMPDIDLGGIGKYKWNRTNFIILKNVIKHVIISLLYAYKKIGFIHKDLHLGNVLLKKTKRKEILYGELGSLELMGILPVIMDYDKSIIQRDSLYLVYDDFDKFINLLHTDMFDIRINSGNMINILDKLLKENKNIHDIISILFNEVDKFTIRHLVSELPPRPDFSKPFKF